MAKAKTRGSTEPLRGDPCCREALISALDEWRRAQEVFDSTDDPVSAELAAIRLEAAGKRYGCLAAQYRKQ